MMKYEQPSMEILKFSDDYITTNMAVSEVGDGEVVDPDNLGWL